MYWIALIAGLIALAYWLFMSPSSQLLGSFPDRAKTAAKVVALTFDDGPNEPYTSQLLDLLRREQVRATFFVVGRNLEHYPDVVSRAAHDGHVIANHSLSHKFRNYFGSLGFSEEITANQKLIRKQIGHTPALFRPPWLFRTPWILNNLAKLGLRPVSGQFVNNWEIFQPSAQRIAASAYKRTRPGSILIFHDGYNAKGAPRAATIEAVGLLIKRLRANGYGFMTVDQLLDLPAYQ